MRPLDELQIYLSKLPNSRWTSKNGFCVFHNRADLEAIANDALVFHERSLPGGREARNFLRVEVCERLLVVLSLLQNSEPAESGLHAFEVQHLEEMPVVVGRHAPFFVMIGNKQLVGFSPAAALAIHESLFTPNLVWESSRRPLSATRCAIGLRGWCRPRAAIVADGPVAQLTTPDFALTRIALDARYGGAARRDSDVRGSVDAFSRIIADLCRCTGIFVGWRIGREVDAEHGLLTLPVQVANGLKSSGRACCNRLESDGDDFVGTLKSGRV